MTLEAQGNQYSGFFCSYADDGEHHDRLKPCPFCGAKIDLEIGNIHTPSFFVACRNCGVEVTGCTPKLKRGGKILTASRALRIFAEAMELAITQWNTRAAPTADQGRAGLSGEDAA
ncbi:Lar family restriction alleviation protein [Variovorax sp. H27-G14]|uniref:Lar family restriction alleviation protein n=1 Tax=Variovorax sp. H27-G14 TaxID=3111914 RepID=UPI0038FCB6F7